MPTDDGVAVGTLSQVELFAELGNSAAGSATADARFRSMRKGLGAAVATDISGEFSSVLFFKGNSVSSYRASPDRWAYASSTPRMICGKDGGAQMGLENFVGYAVEFRWTPKPAGRSQNLYPKHIKSQGLSQVRGIQLALSLVDAPL